MIPLSPVAVQFLNEWKRYGWWRDAPRIWDLVFPSSEGNPLNDNSLREAITRAADKARKQWKGREPFPKRVTPHTFRHGWCRMMLEAGLLLPELMILAGHSNIDQTRAYAQWEISADDKAARLQQAALGGSFGGRNRSARP